MQWDNGVGKDILISTQCINKGFIIRSTIFAYHNFCWKNDIGYYIHVLKVLIINPFPSEKFLKIFHC